VKAADVWHLPIATLILLPMARTGVASAQQVTGVVQLNNTAAPSPETSVALIDSTGGVVAVTMTGNGGYFTLRAPGAGTYRIRARRIGFLPDSSESLTLKVGQQLRQIKLSLDAFPVQLVRVGIQEAQRCVIAPESGVAVFRLWQEAQSALTATVATSHDVRIGFVLHRFERKLDPNTGQIEEAHSWNSRAPTSEPYASIPAESLAAHGFVVPSGKMLMYYAPDARTLISDAFARTHCFRPTEDDSRPDLIGLSFLPTAQRLRDRSVRDVSGTLWFDRVTLDLRTLEFEYRDKRASGAADNQTATGRLEYARLPTGEWVVSHWVIHMPVLTVATTGSAPDGLAATSGGITVLRRNVQQVTSVWEAGGDIVNTVALQSLRDSSVVTSEYGAVRGRIVDTTPAGVREGVRDVRVILRPTRTFSDSAVPYSTFTDSAGTFAIDRVAPATYSVEMSSPQLDTLGIDITPRTVLVDRASQQSFVTVVPTAENMIHNLCRSRLLAAEAVLRGKIRGAANDLIAHARVEVSWFAIADSRQDHFVATTHNVVAFSDDNGEYAVCGVPTDRPLKIVIKDRTAERTMTKLTTLNTQIGMTDFILPSTTPAGRPQE